MLDFLAAGPSIEEIVAYRPPRAAQARFSRLLKELLAKGRYPFFGASQTH